jgi:hypothetical protein
VKAEPPVCLRCGQALPREDKKGPARKYHLECAAELKRERDRDRYTERKSPRRAP